METRTTKKRPLSINEDYEETIPEDPEVPEILVSNLENTVSCYSGNNSHLNFCSRLVQLINTVPQLKTILFQKNGMPTVVIVGPQSSGKTTVLQEVIGNHGAFPVGLGTVTKRPLILTTNQSGSISYRVETPHGIKLETSSNEEVSSFIKSCDDDVSVEYTNKWHVHMTGTKYSLRFVDLPGVTTLACDTNKMYDLCKNVDGDKVTTLIIVIDVSKDWSPNGINVSDILKTASAGTAIIFVMTHCDKLKPQEADQFSVNCRQFYRGIFNTFGFKPVFVVYGQGKDFENNKKLLEKYKTDDQERLFQTEISYIRDRMILSPFEKVTSNQIGLANKSLTTMIDEMNGQLSIYKQVIIPSKKIPEISQIINMVHINSVIRDAESKLMIELRRFYSTYVQQYKNTHYVQKSCDHIQGFTSHNVIRDDNANYNLITSSYANIMSQSKIFAKKAYELMVSTFLEKTVKEFESHNFCPSFTKWLTDKLKNYFSINETSAVSQLNLCLQYSHGCSDVNGTNGALGTWPDRELVEQINGNQFLKDLIEKLETGSRFVVAMIMSIISVSTFFGILEYMNSEMSHESTRFTYMDDADLEKFEDRLKFLVSSKEIMEQFIQYKQHLEKQDTSRLSKIQRTLSFFTFRY
jgi:GTPase Era involved in 16S rRNA processing